MQDSLIKSCFAEQFTEIALASPVNLIMELKKKTISLVKLSFAK